MQHIKAALKEHIAKLEEELARSKQALALLEGDEPYFGNPPLPAKEQLGAATQVAKASKRMAGKAGPKLKESNGRVDWQVVLSSIDSPFTVAQLKTITGKPSSQCNIYLSLWQKTGKIERIARGQYKKLGASTNNAPRRTVKQRIAKLDNVSKAVSVVPVGNDPDREAFPVKLTKSYKERVKKARSKKASKVVEVGLEEERHKEQVAKEARKEISAPKSDTVDLGSLEPGDWFEYPKHDNVRGKVREVNNKAKYVIHIMEGKKRQWAYSTQVRKVEEK